MGGEEVTFGMRANYNDVIKNISKSIYARLKNKRADFVACLIDPEICCCFHFAQNKRLTKFFIFFSRIAKTK